MALVMKEEKHVLAPNGERKVFKKGDLVPKEYLAAWAGKPFVEDKKPFAEDKK